jgi:tRNA pseudouridine38-40 synthase
MMLDVEKRVVRMTLEYDGTNYAGWQRQLNVRTVQQTVEEALCDHLHEPIRVTASGRTDSGVHALGQVISFATATKMPARAIGRGLVTCLPNDVTVVDAQEAAPDFDARRSARLRWYRFFLCNRGVRPAVGARYLTHVRGTLDFDLMRQAAATLSGEHDFSAFRSVKCSASRTALSMQPIELTQLPNDIIQIDFKCRSFLHNMVRILTGTMVAAGRGRVSVADIERMLATGVRVQQVVTAEPCGLFLYRVEY